MFLIISGVLPKAYLVVLIVGATIAVFLACIPYDFYRFRKRKKKVRDHQERLSLVTRIAPGHAKVVQEVLPASQNPMAYPQARRFGLKSLFSVFRFVGGKTRSLQEHLDASNPVCDEGLNSEVDPGAETTPPAFSNTDSCCAKASSDDSNLEHDESDPSNDVINMCPLVVEHQLESSNPEVSGENEEDGDTRPRSSSPLVLDNNNKQDSETLRRKGFQVFKKANEIFSRDSSSSNSKSLRSADNSVLSEPATVEVTSMNDTVSSDTENLRESPQNEFGTSNTDSPVYSASSPEDALLKKDYPKAEHLRTFHYPSGKNSIAYHSMPAISDIP